MHRPERLLGIGSYPRLHLPSPPDDHLYRTTNIQLSYLSAATLQVPGPLAKCSDVVARRVMPGISGGCDAVCASAKRREIAGLAAATPIH